MRRARNILTLAALLLVTGTATFAALPAYMRVQGQQQGNIQGDVVLKGREGTIQVIQLKHEIVSPRDPATGQATGKRQHKPLTIRMEMDKSTPHLYQALITNETLTTVEIKFYVADAAGKEVNYFTVKLTNAQISSIQSVLPDVKNPDSVKYPSYLDIGFTYQKIEWTWTNGGVTASDDWESPAV